jgi:tRNA A37 threonylcarbamoyltransferase TsaD
MIAYAGYRRFLMGEIQNLEISACPRWSMSEF